MVPKLESVVLGLENEVMISKSVPHIFCRVVLHGPVDSRNIPEWLYIIWVHTAVRKKGALDLKKGATPRIPSANLKNSGAKIKIRRKGLSIKDFGVPIFILKNFQPRDSTDSPPIYVF